MTSSLGPLRRLAGQLRRHTLAHRRALAGLFALLAVVLGLQAARPAPPTSTSLVVAARDLPAGTVLTTADLATVEVPPAAVPAGSQSAATGRTLAAGVRRGEPITDLRLVGPTLTDGHRDLSAVPVRLPDAGMAALLRVGDRIRLLATDAQEGTTAAVADDALVLALPAADEGGSGTKAATNGVTSGLGGRLVVVGIAESLVTRVTSAAVRDFLTYAYPN